APAGTTRQARTRPRSGATEWTRTTASRPVAGSWPRTRGWAGEGKGEQSPDKIGDDARQRDGEHQGRHHRPVLQRRGVKELRARARPIEEPLDHGRRRDEREHDIAQRRKRERE